MITVHPGDCLAVIPQLVSDGVLVDAIVTDPPYGLEFMGKEWDSFRGASGPIKKSGYKKLGQHGTPVFNAGRHNQKCPRCDKWSYDYPDRKCICGGAEVEGRRLFCSAFQEFSEAWGREAIQILKPGGFLVAFGGTRTYHRMVCGLEDAGFVIQDTIAWLYGTGFPKNKALLKPAFEPIVLAYKPGGKRTMQIDECRIGDFVNQTPPGTDRFNQANFEHGYRPNAYAKGRGGEPSAERRYTLEGSTDFAATPGPRGGSSLGRWPANVVHDGSEEVLAAFPQSAPSIAKAGRNGRDDGTIFAIGRKEDRMRGHDDNGGSAARFFFSAKAGAQDRWGSRHPTVKPVELMKWLVALVCPPGGLVLDPFAGSGTTGVAALATGRNAILIEREAAYVADIRERLAFYKGGGGHSVQAKHRNRAVDHGPLFAAASLTPEEDAADSILSYSAAITAIGERVKAGEPVPEFMLSRKAQP